jgi:hypothetical protein
MSDQAIRLGPGMRVSYDGDPLEVVELSGTRVTIRNERTGQFAVVALTRFGEQLSRLARSRRHQCQRWDG